MVRLTAEWHDFDQMNIVNDNGNANPELAVEVGVGSARGANEFRCVAPLRN